MGVMDSLTLASALQNNLIVATRNVADFLPGGVQVINPSELNLQRQVILQ
jgi:predicted nucleic acid-binding protein